MSSVLFKVVKMVLRKVSTKLMDKVGSKIVSGMADTSSDAPNAFYKPKRDVHTPTPE